MFNIGLAEILVILIVALIVIGPKELPVIAGKIGELIRGFRGLKEDLKIEGFSRATNATVLKADEKEDD